MDKRAVWRLLRSASLDLLVCPDRPHLIYARRVTLAHQLVAHAPVRRYGHRG